MTVVLTDRTHVAQKCTGVIRTATDGTIGRITIDNPARRNALTRTMCIELVEAVEKLDADPAVKVIALTGAGGDFSAGANITDLHGVLFDDDHPEAPYDRFSAADAALSGTRKPTFALVRGICMGGGWQIASACDVVIAADNARLAVTPAKLGIIYPRPGVERLVRMVGADRAKYILFTAAEIPPATAERWGLVTEVVRSDEFTEHTEWLLRSVAERSQYSVHTMKALIDAPVTAPGSLEQAWQQAWSGLPGSEDFAHGQRAFLAGEKPVFTWAPSS